MNENELKEKLAVLKSASVPKGYWENYGPRLKMKMERERVHERASIFSRASWNWTAPALAFILPVLIGAYYLGQRNAEKNILKIPHVRLASYEGDERAKHVFHEMLQLFPNRVNWITYVNGKVDFSISSVAFKDTEPLVPFVITIPQPQGGFEARVLLRPGQEAAVHSIWNDNTTVDVKWHLDGTGKGIHTNCRLTTSDISAAVEGDTHLKPNQGTILGALRWRAQLLQVQLTRLDESAKTQATKPAKKTEPRSTQT